MKTLFDFQAIKADGTFTGLKSVLAVAGGGKTAADNALAAGMNYAGAGSTLQSLVKVRDIDIEAV